MTSSTKPPVEAGTDLTYIYTLIHSFLKERSHTKAASALKKAVNGSIPIDDGTEYKGPTLQNILKEWRALKAGAGPIYDSSSDSSSDDDTEVENNLTGKKTIKSKPSPVDSSDDSSSDSDSDNDDTPRKAISQGANLQESQSNSSKTLSSADDGDSKESTDETSSDSSDESDVDTDSGTVPSSKKAESKRKSLQAKKPATSSSDTSSSSSSDSSSGEVDQLPNLSKRKAMSTSSSESDSSSDSNSDDDSEVPGTNQSTRNAPSSSSSDSSSSSESDTSGSSSSAAGSDDLNSPKKRSAIQSRARTSAGPSSSSSEFKDELEETPALPVTPDPDVRASKKRRAGEDGAAVVTATTAKTPAGTARGGKASRKANTPFQRVNAHAVKYFDEKLKDNSFESRGARGDDYGAKASRDLIVTRGDGFRKEKNKKKRGSYRGGDITLNSHSFKFED